MKIQSLEDMGIPARFVEKIGAGRITDLYPPQDDAIKAGVLDGRSIVLSVPTAAGKTLVATMAMIKALERGEKCVYIVPLVALASEKYEYFKEFFDGYKVAISVGDLDSKDPWLAGCDVIVCTTEKLDSLIRHGSPWIANIGLVVVDEVHMLNDASRGPTLEILMTRLRIEAPKAQTIALSATIKNSKDIADWMGAKLVVSDFRPVKLHEGVAYGSEIKFHGRTGYTIDKGDLDTEVARHTIGMRKQAIMFVCSRRNAEGLAEKLRRACRECVGKAEAAQLEDLSEDVLNVLETPTRQCKKIAACVKSGVAFHHAGLLGKQRKLIEEGFKKGLVKIIAATPTLAMGVNLPAFRVVIRDAKRYYPGRGLAFIPVLEYKQFVGRAGRPQFDSFGESILISRGEEEADELTEKFILGEPEEIYSKLAIEPVLRMHTLALIASGFAQSEKALLEFFGKTFYGFQYGSLDAIEEKLYDIVDNLKLWKFVALSEGRLKATRMGKRVSDLYIDPLSASKFIKELDIAGKRRVTAFGMLHAISNTLEMRPMLNVRAGEFKDMNSFIEVHKSEFLCDVPEEWDFEFDDFMRSVKTAKLFEAWVSEMKEDEIISRFNVAPGELYTRLKLADWLLYSMQEIALLLGKKDMLRAIRNARVRVKYGVKEQLLPLVRLKGIGRARGRRLYAAGLKSLSDLRKVPLASLQNIIGHEIAAQIKDQLGEDVELPAPKPKQTTLG